MRQTRKEQLKQEYDALCSVFGIGQGLWLQLHESPSPYAFCEANRKSFIAEYFMLEEFSEKAKEEGFIYYFGIDTFLEAYKNVVYNRVRIED